MLHSKTRVPMFHRTKLDAPERGEEEEKKSKG